MSTATMRRKIAIAIDAESPEQASKVISWTAANLLKPLDDVHLIMVVVMDPEFFGHEETIEASILGDHELERLEQEASAKHAGAMRAWSGELVSQGYKTTTHILKSGPAHPTKVITEYVDTAKFDCLVLGSRNLSGWRRTIFGSFSDYVQQHVHCPVLIVK
ncbi:hypothetical protein VTP01DRAFT_9220 [Rhizomucor pusillus]|uniref:uncharacterized protein n=1 Tax=Rhizomucor pusillus TaxID=4840 RepID=UPI003743DE70